MFGVIGSHLDYFWSLKTTIETEKFGSWLAREKMSLARDVKSHIAGAGEAPKLVC